MPERILVYGVTGSGKTSLAARISAAMAIPWHAVNDLAWEPGWIEVPYGEQRRRIAAICAEERWVLDAAYGKWLDVPLARVDLIVALDFPRWLSLARLIRRSVVRAIDGKEITATATESRSGTCFRGTRSSAGISSRSPGSAGGSGLGKPTRTRRPSCASPRDPVRSSVGCAVSRRQERCVSPSVTQARSSSDWTNVAPSASARASTSSADAPARRPA